MSGGPASVLGDRAALERALANLFGNARRHGSGQITIETGTKDGLALVTVADEGPGLGPEEARQAFERFWRGGRATAGSGLGLAIVRATTERHGGRVYVEGARFTIELPVVRDVSEPGATKEGEEPEKGLP
jgi:signal transduction histidine kinase